MQSRIDVTEVKKIVTEAGKLFQNREAVCHTTVKGAADYVTEVDFAVQQYVSRQLQERYPDIQFMSEEKENDEIDANGAVWVLDPVDGTTNLIHDYRASAVSLALLEQGRAVLGIVYSPYSGEMFLAEEGKGCYLNGSRVYVSGVQEIEQCLIAVGTSPYYKEMAEKNFRVFKRLFCDCQDIRRSGSAALDLAYVACGRVEGYFERRLKIWDYAAGMLLVREAGGAVLYYDGEQAGTAPVADIVAGSRIVAELLVSKYLAELQ